MYTTHIHGRYTGENEQLKDVAFEFRIKYHINRGKGWGM